MDHTLCHCEMSRDAETLSVLKVIYYLLIRLNNVMCCQHSEVFPVKSYLTFKGDQLTYL